MTEIPTAAVYAVDFDPHADEHVAALTAMFRDYLLEELDRLGHFAAGIPLSNWLKTFLIYAGGEPVGFCSADFTRYAIELVYVRPPYRRLGIARQMLTDLRDSCPRQMHVKLPLSPGGQIMADSLGIPSSAPTQAEVAKGEKAIADLHQTIRQHCTHKRTGDPRQPCRRCYRVAIKRCAVAMVTEPCLALRSIYGRSAA